MLGVKRIKILMETFSFYQFRGSTPSFVKPDKWDLHERYRGPNLDEKCFQLFQLL